MRRRFGWLVPYLFLLPGGLWLLAFFVVPMVVMASISLQEGSLGTGLPLTWNFGIYPGGDRPVVAPDRSARSSTGSS